MKVLQILAIKYRDDDYEVGVFPFFTLLNCIMETRDFLYLKKK